MQSTTKLRIVLNAALAALMLVAGLELATISNTVYWLHYRAGKDFTVSYQGSDFSLHGKPAGLLVDQGHTSNGAAGTAFVLVSVLGFISLALKCRRHAGGFSNFVYIFWLAMTVLSAALAIAALIYTFVITYQHDGQSIDVALASGLNNRPYPDYVAYPLGSWTPENWLAAVLNLDLAKQSERNDIEVHLDLVRVWRWNLIPLTAFGLVVVILAFAHRRAMLGQERRRLMGVGRVGKAMVV